MQLRKKLSVFLKKTPKTAVLLNIPHIIKGTFKGVCESCSLVDSLRCLKWHFCCHHPGLFMHKQESVGSGVLYSEPRLTYPGFLLLIWLHLSQHRGLVKKKQNFRPSSNLHTERPVIFQDLWHSSLENYGSVGTDSLILTIGCSVRSPFQCTLLRSEPQLQFCSPSLKPEGV